MENDRTVKDENGFLLFSAFQLSFLALNMNIIVYVNYNVCVCVFFLGGTNNVSFIRLKLEL